MEYLNGDMKYLTEQKPGETIFDCVTGKSFSEARILASSEGRHEDACSPKKA